MRRGAVALCAALWCLSLSACDSAEPASESRATETPRGTPAPSPFAIADPPGDPGVPSSMGHLDARSAGVEKRGDAFVFGFTLSAPIPEAVEVPDPWDAVLWSFCVDADRASVPMGYPFAETTSVPCEFIVAARSTGSAPTAFVIDRRPLLEGARATTSPAELDMAGASVRLTVPAEALGRPSRFTWVMATTMLSLPLGTDEFADLDEVPDSSFARPARWPSS